jgi:CHAT domain-containing protein
VLELCDVARKLGVPETELLLGANASETRLKKMSVSGSLADCRVLHFATHALVAGERDGLAEPALILTPPDDTSEEDDGILTALEVAQLKLNADWVIL